MGPIEIIGAGAKGFAKFASKHAVLTAAAVTTAGVGGYVAYDNYKGADGANGGGAVVKRDVAVNDKKRRPAGRGAGNQGGSAEGGRTARNAG